MLCLLFRSCKAKDAFRGRLVRPALFSSRLPPDLQVLVSIYSLIFIRHRRTPVCARPSGELGVGTQDELGPSGVAVRKGKGP